MKRLFLNYYLFIILVLLLANFAVLPLVERFAAAPFRSNFVRYYRELVRGPLSLVVQDLQRVPQERWEERLAQLRPHFGYPLTLAAIGSGSFSEPQRAQLREGQILVSDGYDLFWQRVGASGLVLGMGPFPDRGVGKAVDAAIAVVFLSLLGVVALVWVVPFWRKLSSISRTAVAFGDGELDLRVNIARRSSLSPLAESFNRMAGRIQRLISSHKALTNAVAHELRTPIARLRFGVEMAETATDPEARTRYVAGVHRDLDELNALVAELLTYARFDRDAPDLRLQEGMLAPLLEEVVEAFSAEFGGRLEFVVAADAGTAKTQVEPRELRRAVRNLVHNAVRHGGGKVRLTQERAGVEILIHVDDDGPGIPELDRERIFEPFCLLAISCG